MAAGAREVKQALWKWSARPTNWAGRVWDHDIRRQKRKVGGTMTTTSRGIFRGVCSCNRPTKQPCNRRRSEPESAIVNCSLLSAHRCAECQSIISYRGLAFPTSSKYLNDWVFGRFERSPRDLLHRHEMLDGQGSGSDGGLQVSLGEATLAGDRPNRILAPGRLGQPMSRRGRTRCRKRRFETWSGAPHKKLLFFPSQSLQLHLCPFHLRAPPLGVAASV